MEMILFMVVIIGLGIWTKHQNTKHFRKLAKELKEKYRG